MSDISFEQKFREQLADIKDGEYYGAVHIVRKGNDMQIKIMLFEDKK